MLVRTWILGALFVLVLGVGAQAATIDGCLVDAERRPAVDYEVALRPALDPVTAGRMWLRGETPEALDDDRTDEQGCFSLDGTLPARLVVWTTDGRATSVVLPPFDGDVFLPALEVPRLEVREIQVVDPRDRPIPGVIAALVKTQYSSRDRTLLLEPEDDKARTDAAGRARLIKRVDAKLSVVAYHPDHRQERPSRDARVVLEPVHRQVVQVRDVEGALMTDALVLSSSYAIPVAVTDERGIVEVPNRTDVTIADLENGLATYSFSSSKPRLRPWDFELTKSSITSGRVTTESGAPFAGAVVFSPAALEMVKTDENGEFRLRKLDSWTPIWAAAPGYLTGLIRRSTLSDPSRVAALEPTRELSGQVTAEGQPVEGVVVRTGFHFWPARDVFPSPTAARTRADGRYVTLALPADERRLEVKVAHAGYARRVLDIDSPRTGPVRVDVALMPTRGASGQVVDEQGQPIAGVEVRVIEEPSGPHRADQSPQPVDHEATTAADGRFELAHLGSGSWRLVAKVDGYAPAAMTGVGVEALRTITLRRGASLSGEVVDSDGKPIEKATVSIYLERSAHRNLHTVLTDSDGRFIVDNVDTSQSYVLSFGHIDYTFSRLHRVQAPDSGIRVVLERLIRVTGSVVDRRGEPIERCQIDDGSNHTRSSLVCEQGRFSIDVSPRTETLTFSAHCCESVTIDVDLTPGQKLDGIEAVLARGARIEGVVRDARGEPVAGAEVTPRVNPRSRIVTDSEGRFVLEAVAPGSRTLTVRHDEFLAYRADLELVAGGSVRHDVALERGQRLRGTVLGDGVPVTNARVLLRASRDGVSSNDEVFTEADGTFALVLPDGTYTLWADHEDWGSTRLTSKIILHGQDRDDVKVEFPRPGRLTVTVRGIAEERLPELEVVAYADPAGTMRVGESQGDGRYRFGGLSPGRWQVHVKLERHQVSERKMVEIASDDERVMELDAEPERSEMVDVVVTVRRNGELVNDARVDLKTRHAFGSSSIGYRTADAAGRYMYQAVRGATVVIEASDADGGYGRVEIVAEGPIEQEITLRVSRVEGRVIDPAGKPVAEATIRGASKGEGRGGYATSDKEGRFQLNGVYGDLRVEVEKKGFVASEQPVTMAIGEVRQLDFVLDPASPLRLRARHADGRPVGELQARVLDDRNELAVYHRRYWLDDGVLTIDGLDAGSYTVIAAAPGSQVVETTVDTTDDIGEITLFPEGRVVLQLPDLPDPVGIMISVTDPSGRALRFPTYDRVGAVGSPVAIGHLPQGEWTLDVTAATIKENPDPPLTWRTTVSVVAGQTVDVVLD
ncbi:MAG: carboxypeptidase-like regulatory domain-containing protein [Acidobacteriota bacterium]